MAKKKEKEKTAAEWLEEMENTFYSAEIFKKVPKNLKTAEFCMAAVQKSGSALEHVPENLKTAEMCLAAVQKSGYALQYVPDNLKTAELCLAAVQEDGNALKYVPDNLKTAEFCLATAQKKTTALQYIPKEIMTEEWLLALAKYLAEKQGKYYIPRFVGREIEKLDPKLYAKMYAKTAVEALMQRLSEECDREEEQRIEPYFGVLICTAAILLDPTNNYAYESRARYGQLLCAEDPDKWDDSYNWDDDDVIADITKLFELEAVNSCLEPFGLIPIYLDRAALYEKKGDKKAAKADRDKAKKLEAEAGI